MSKIIPCVLIVGIIVFCVITVGKIEQMPSDDSCVNIKCPTCYGNYNCNDYNYWEKIRYVWNLY